MRITFIGKGGSGKTSIATLFVHYLKNKDKKILAVDADLNDHFGIYLGFKNKPPYLADNYFKIRNYIFEEYPFKYLPKIGTIPPRNECRFFNTYEDDFVLKNFSIRNNNIFYLNTGIYTKDEIGNACFHGKLNSLELYLNYLIDCPDDFVIIDAMAGTDFLATSLYAISDIYFFVVEPDKLSIGVLNEYLNVLEEKIKEFDIKIYLILNKIDNEKEIDFILKNIQKKEYLQTTKKEDLIIFSFEPLFRLIEQDQLELDLINKIIQNQKDSLKKIEKIAQLHKNRDYKKYLEKWLKIYENECKVWVNESYKTDFTQLIDYNFSLDSYFKRKCIS